MIDGFSPEGILFETESNTHYLNSLAGLKEAWKNKKIVEAKAQMCDASHNLIFQLGAITAIMPKSECEYKKTDQEIKDIAVISRVNKPTCFLISEIDETGDTPRVFLSRRRAQELFYDYALNVLSAGDIINARVTHLESFGAFVDIGCGVVSLVSTENISISRISNPNDRFLKNQDIKVVIKQIDKDAMRFFISHKELLGTWEENAQKFDVGQTVLGVVRSIESYGIFIELTPNLVGLCEYQDGVTVGQTAAVYIKNIIKEKMKIKLSIVELFPQKNAPEQIHYFLTDGHIDYWRYTPLRFSKENYRTTFLNKNESCIRIKLEIISKILQLFQL